MVKRFCCSSRRTDCSIGRVIRCLPIIPRCEVLCCVAEAYRNLNKKIVWAYLCDALIVVLLSTGSHVAKADTADSSGTVLGIVILSPTNRTYDSRSLTLEVTFGFGRGMQYSVTYNVDGKYEGSIPWTIKNPTELHVAYPATGSLELPELTEGLHSITVSLVAEGFVSGQNPRTYLDTVYFVLDSTPPNISDFSLENKTYLTADVQLNFTVNECTSLLTYSLDGEDNVTIDGNTTLTGLSVGAYNITVYARDIAGNIGSSQTMNFVVAQETKPETDPFPTTLAITISGASLSVIGIGLLVYFKKRKRKPD